MITIVYDWLDKKVLKKEGWELISLPSFTCAKTHYYRLVRPPVAGHLNHGEQLGYPHARDLTSMPT
ncbi:hypothetical protein MUG84_10005 [Paenibacillus sp. KQZ6P-2]|uniref:Uncharacterized protein n=1 Tax=Paenibacillus mangrovi TaxID=2931978 RepID=A0A9X2B290_9BACL|nr:hypothetical protein [Paenibacillus mangrovi]MCJ8012076.1 hypothetical protein [Paenibacillus mangrovi]